jgi:hypothetical protein
LLAAGQLERARTVAQRALELSLTHRERGHQAWALHLLGDIAAAGDDAERARTVAHYGEAMLLAEELKMHPLAARIRLSLGHLHRRAGNLDAAQEELAASLVAFRGMDMRLWSSKVAEELMKLGHLFIVARHNIELHEYLTRELAGEPITVVLDRRDGDRRQGDEAPPTEERRHSDRRRTRTQEALRARGFMVIPDSDRCPPGPAPQ